MEYKYIICGAGLAGMVICEYLIQHRGVSTRDLLILEADTEPGGLYRPWESQKLGLVDKGMHIYYETGVPEIDDIVRDSLDQDEWVVLEGNRKDIAGAVFNNNLQKNTPYPDLRNISASQKELFINEIFERFRQRTVCQGIESPQTCQAYWEERFGKQMTEDVFNKIALKLYGHAADKLDRSAAYLTKLDRVCLFEKQTMEDLGISAELRRVLAYPEQLEMPDYRKNMQRGLYPRKGMKYLSEQMAESLERKGVRIQYKERVVSLQQPKTIPSSRPRKSILELFTVNSETKKRSKVLAEKVVWTGSNDLLSQLLKPEGESTQQTNNGSPEESCSIFVYYRINRRQHDLGDLYYAYLYDQNTNPFRITNLASYSQKKNGGKESTNLLCLEYHFTKEQYSKLSEHLVCGLSTFISEEFDELKRLRIVDGCFLEADGFKIPRRVFPVPLLQQGDFSGLKTEAPRNIVYSGREGTARNFFLVDSLRSFHFQLNEG